LPVDATGKIVGTVDVNGPYDGAIALSETLSRSRTVHECATRQWLRYTLGRATVDAEQPLVMSLAKAFTASNGDVRALMLGIVTSPTFRTRIVEED
jgi:hypothetical protein